MKTLLKWVFAWTAVSSLAVTFGCASPLTHPMKADGAEPVTVGQFGDLDEVPDTFKGRSIMMAGRIIGAEAQGQGVAITAEWLPMPKDVGKGPSDAEMQTDHRFVVHYPHNIDSAGLWNGNKFIVVGWLEPSEPTPVHSLPGLSASCLHIWKTRELSISGTLGADKGMFPVLEQTYCRNS